MPRGVPALRLKHAPQTHGAGRTRSESDRVVRIARGEDLGPFAAAPRERKLNDRFASESHREPHTDAVLQVGESELTDVFSHFAPLREDGKSEWIDQSPFIAQAVRDRVGCPESVVRVAREPVFVVDVAAAQCRLEVEGYRVA